jgi:hypothetical protein
MRGGQPAPLVRAAHPDTAATYVLQGLQIHEQQQAI